MILIKHIKNLQEILSSFRSSGKSAGFVPTMGALHAGHISLLKTCRAENDIAVASIFINPTQFNNKQDLEKYPVTLEADIDKLEEAGCDILFLPSVEEMYPAGEAHKQYDLGIIETLLEGKYRPGHFQGVCIIVDKLLQAVQPDNLYMGRKDYQQCMVIKKMLELTSSPVQLHIEETVREKDGLAMSSRNMRLNENERTQALKIIESLKMIEDHISPGEITGLKNNSVSFLNAQGFKTDYVEIADAATLQPVSVWDGKQKLVALAATYLNEIRLIDNIVLKTDS